MNENCVAAVPSSSLSRNSLCIVMTIIVRFLDHLPCPPRVHPTISTTRIPFIFDFYCCIILAKWVNSLNPLQSMKFQFLFLFSHFNGPFVFASQY